VSLIWIGIILLMQHLFANITNGQPVNLWVSASIHPVKDRPDDPAHHARLHILLPPRAWSVLQNLMRQPRNWKCLEPNSSRPDQLRQEQAVAAEDDVS